MINSIVEVEFVKARSKKLGLAMLCIKKTKHSAYSIGTWGYCYDPSWFNIIKKFWQPYHINIKIGEYIIASTNPKKSNNILTEDMVRLLIKDKENGNKST